MDSVHTNEAKILRYPRLPPLDMLRLSPQATRPPAGRDHSCPLQEPLRTLSTDLAATLCTPLASSNTYQAPGASTRAESQDRAPGRTSAAGAAPQHTPCPSNRNRGTVPALTSDTNLQARRRDGRDRKTSKPAGLQLPELGAGPADFRTRGGRWDSRLPDSGAGRGARVLTSGASTLPSRGEDWRGSRMRLAINQ